jgi:hypothetical protein
MVEKTLASVNNTLDNYLKVLDNEYVSGFLRLFIMLYAGLAAPELPKKIADLFKKDVFKIVIFILILLVARKKPDIAILTAVAFMLTIQTINKYDIAEHMTAYTCTCTEKEEPEINTKQDTADDDDDDDVIARPEDDDDDDDKIEGNPNVKPMEEPIGVMNVDDDDDNDDNNEPAPASEEAFTPFGSKFSQF